jgi:predicted GIY-YIG superfamily endonuclease
LHKGCSGPNSTITFCHEVCIASFLVVIFSFHINPIGNIIEFIINNSNVNDFNMKNIIIINKFDSTSNEVEELIEIHGKPFELLTIIGTRSIGIRDNSWDGVIYSRHGGAFKKWWMDERRQNIPIQIDTLPDQLPFNDNYTLVFIRINQFNIEKLRNQFMQNIGGQVHVQCANHRLPLITSMDRNKKCACGRKDHYRCSEFNCDVYLCKKCFDTIELNDNNDVTFISSVTRESSNDNNSNTNNINEENDDNISINSNIDSIISSEDELQEPFDHEEQLRQFLDENNHTEDEGGTDQFEDFLITSNEPDEFDILDVNDEFEEENQLPEDIFLQGLIPTTNAGDSARTIVEETTYGGSFGKITISGHVILNQCGTLLSRKKHQIKGSSRHHFFLQRIVATNHGSSVPLIYPEGILFPSIHWKTAPDNCSIIGCLPAPLLTESSNGSRFASIQSHVRSRLTNSSCSTSTDARYCAHCYDMLTNASANHEDTRLILNRGLTIGNDKTGGLGLRGKGDSSLLESVDNKQMVRNLCMSQKYVQWDHFLTHTCNMKTHFGTAPVKNWIDGNEWKKNFPGYFNLEIDQRKEIDQALVDSSGTLLLRIWEEIFPLFIDYLKYSPSSPFKRFLAVFARKEYQSNRGNLDHDHMMLALNFNQMNEEEKAFVNDLIRASIYDIVRSDEVPRMIEEGIFNHPEDVHTVYEDAEKFLGHRCNDSCLVRRPDGTYRCRKIDNVKASLDNTKHMFQPLANDYSVPCLLILEEIGLTTKLIIDDDGNILEFESSLSFFHPNRHIPPTNPTNDMNISPVEGTTFAVFRSMQNVQRLTGTGGCAKYVCKYIAKIDEQNYVVIMVDGEGRLVTQANFLHNTKITSSKMGEDKERMKNEGKPQGRCISHLEMLHMLLKYPEIVTNLDFIKVTTMPLELRAGIAINCDAQHDEEDGAYVGCAMDVFRKSLNGLEDWRMMTQSQLLITDDLKLSKVSVDKVTQFSLRPPELLTLFNKLGEYFRWFIIDTSKISVNKLERYVDVQLEKSCWIDCLQRRVRVRKKALPEIMNYINADIQEERQDDEGRRKTIDLFRRINELVMNSNGANSNENDEVLDEDNHRFQCHVYQDLLVDDDNKDHLPIPVFSYITPTMTTSFLLHIMLSMGQFETEVDILMHENLRECLRYCKLIGENNDDESLKSYANNLTKRYIIEQVQYFPNSKRVIDHWIITASNLFRSIIVNDEIPVTEMPSVQLSNILSSQVEEILNYRMRVKQNIIDAAYEELGDANVHRCQIPTKQDLIESSSDNQLDWDPVNSLSRNVSQSEESFDEQQFAIRKIVESINRYRNLSSQTIYTKNIGIRGSPGGGKTWCMMYLVLYAISQGNVVVTTALMCKRAIQLGGIHIAQLFKNPSQSTASAHRQAELAILSLMRKPEKLEFLRSLNIIFFDEMGQISDTLLSILDIILRKIRNSNIYMGGVLIIYSMDHTQIQPINGRPFLTSCHVIPCFQAVTLKHSVRASNDLDFVRIQTIARMNYKKFELDPNLVDEFITLCSDSFTFVDSWESDKILPSTMRLFSKKIPAREASRQFVASVKRQVASNEYIERLAEDLEKPVNSRADWIQATENTSHKMEQKVKEPQLLLFFRGAIFEMTFNAEGQFSNTQTCILFDIPSVDDLQNWRKIKVLKTPTGLREITFDPDASKEDYIEKGFVEVSVGIAPGRTQYLGGGIQSKRKQYGLKHHFTSTIHAAMGDTLSSMAIEISFANSNFKMWDKGQMIVITSRTRMAQDTIFVGDKNDTLNALRHLLTRKTQWTDYMENVLDIITLLNDDEDDHFNEEEQEVQGGQALPERQTNNRTLNPSISFPFRICDISLPMCNTGYVYMLLSMRNQQFTYIGKTDSIRRRIREHNTGVGSVSTEPTHLRPYALFAYICGANCNDGLLLYLERQWKIKRDRLIANRVNDVKEWAYCGNEIISELNSENFGVRASDLTLVVLFKE